MRPQRGMRMLCYRDITFCPYYMDCEEGNDCPRALKPHIIGKAAEAGLDISAYLDRPEGFAAIRPKGDGNESHERKLA